jgi:hypothetical protein
MPVLVTRSGASAAHFIYDSMHAEQDWSAGPPIPVGFSVFSGDPHTIVRRVLDPEGTNPNWFEHERGGHFPALEVPKLLLADIRAFFRSMRG